MIFWFRISNQPPSSRLWRARRLDEHLKWVENKSAKIELCVIRQSPEAIRGCLFLKLIWDGQISLIKTFFQTPFVRLCPSGLRRDRGLEEILIYKIGRTWNANWVAARKSAATAQFQARMVRISGTLASVSTNFVPEAIRGSKFLRRV